MHFYPVPSLLHRRPGGRFKTVLCRLCSCSIVSPRRHAVSILIVSVLSFSAPLPADSILVWSKLFHLHSQRLTSIRCRLQSARVYSSPSQFSSLLLPFLLLSNPRASSPMRVAAYRNHACAKQRLSVLLLLGPSRIHAYPLPVNSSTCRAVHGHAISVPLCARLIGSSAPLFLRFDSIPLRFNSDLGLSDLCTAYAVRILAPPLASLPVPLVSAPGPASPCPRHANRVESILLRLISYCFNSLPFQVR